MRVVGELANPDQLVVDTKIEQLDLKLFDYRVRNDGPIELTLDQNVLEIGRFRLAGEGTQLQLDGRLGLKDQTLDAAGRGRREPRHPAGVLPRRCAAAGTADLKAQLTGTVQPAGVLRQRDDHRRPAPALLAAALARGDQRPGRRSTRAACASTR